jgi:hypothetical protein
MLKTEDYPEVRQRSFAEFTLSEANGLRMTARGCVILSAAKDLPHAFIQQARLTSPWGFWVITSKNESCRTA